MMFENSNYIIVITEAYYKLNNEINLSPANGAGQCSFPYILAYDSKGSNL